MASHYSHNSDARDPQPNEFSDTSFAEEIADKPILSINVKNKQLGAAFWKPDDSTIVILGDMQCANVFDMLDLGANFPKLLLSNTVVKLQTTPTIILVPSRADESFLNALQPSGAEEYTVSIRPTSEFSYEKARQKILKLAEILPYSERLQLELPEDAFSGNGGTLLRMGGVVEWNKCVSVSISFLSRVEIMIGWLCWCFTYLSQQTYYFEQWDGLSGSSYWANCRS